jgi:phospholipase/lecithinase/hemolysin
MNRFRRILLGSSLGMALALAHPAAAFQVADPYASSASYDSIGIDRLWAFGDSYTKAGRKTFPNWAEQLVGALEVGTLKDYAVSGATAGTYANYTNDFTLQANRFVSAAATFHARDLTVVYLGYNDIDGGTDLMGGDLASAKSNYKTQLSRIIAAHGGATASNRRVFIVMVHNWGRVPYYVQNGGVNTMRSRTRVWDNFIAATAAANRNVVAVDLYDALEYVFSDTTKYGFTNIATPDHANSDTTAFWDDWFHPGQHGQFMIRQVVEYYLTRGWDWSNTTKKPADAKAKLIADLAAGNVFTRPYPETTPAPQARLAPAPAPKVATAPPTAAELANSPERFGTAWARSRGK